MSKGERSRFAVVIPVGPTAIDLWRGVELITSLLAWEPDVTWCVIVDDAPNPRGLDALAAFPRSCQVTTVMNPRRGAGNHWGAGVIGGIFVALDWLAANADPEFVLIIETDALVINSFATSVNQLLARMPDAGMLGTLWPAFQERFLADFKREPPLLVAYRLLSSAAVAYEADTAGLTLFVDGAGAFSLEARRHFDMIRPHIDVARANGYASKDYCQGGAQVLSRKMLVRMSEAGYLQYPERWMHMPFYGEAILSMYVRAIGLRSYDCSRPGQPFAIKFRGVPFTLEELVTRGHSLVHSLKGDRRYSENEIREFFAKRIANAGERGTATKHA